YDCKQYPIWSLGLELCAAQGEDQSFFYIEENIDPKMIKDKASYAVITVVIGNVNSKAIETEFVTALGKDRDTWKWTARLVDDGKYIMRFPSAQMVRVWGYFRPLGTRTMQAQIMIDPWNPAIGSKGMLQRGWFRIRGIPSDQRAVKTIAKVGGLVGKVEEVDEKTIKKIEYVRARIACRNVTKNTSDYRRVDGKEHTAKTVGGGIIRERNTKENARKQSQNYGKGSYSAPPKVQRAKNGEKFMADAQKAIKNQFDPPLEGLERVQLTYSDDEDNGYGGEMERDLPEVGRGEASTSGIVHQGPLVVYGPAHDDKKNEFLAELSSFCARNSEPYVIGGDFNIIRFSHERNKIERMHRHSPLFNSVIQNYELVEIDMPGGQYTWSNNQEHPTLVKLDKVLMSKQWEIAFPQVLMQKLPREVSDHNPLIICT
ncbi:hypothetical protein U9M48_042654, partial [Paspalum notatum var. saurae]